MSSLPARMKMIKSKVKELEWSQYFSHYKYRGIFQDAQGQRLRSPLFDLAEFQTRLRCWGCPHYLQECKNTEDPIKNESARVVIRFSPL